MPCSLFFLLNFGFCKTVWKTYLLLDVCQTTTPMYPPKKFYMYIHLLQPRVWTMIPCQFWVRHHCFASFTNFFLSNIIWSFKLETSENASTFTHGYPFNKGKWQYLYKFLGLHTLSIVSSGLLSSSSQCCIELSTINDKSFSLISNATAVECSTCKSIPWL